MKYSGHIEQVYFTNQNWSSIRVKLNTGKRINAAGKITNPIVGYNIKITGEFKVDPKFGPQISVSDSKVIKAKSDTGIIAYLSSGLIKGVGESLARRIVKAFGEDTLKIIENEPERLQEVSGIKEKKMQSIVESHTRNNVFSELYEFLDGQVTVYQASKIIDKYGDDCIRVIRDNPYILIYELDGFGFKKADKIAQAAGVKDDSIHRVSAAIIYVLKTMSESGGHCFATAHELQQQTLDVLIHTPKFVTKTMQRNLFGQENVWEHNRQEVVEEYGLPNWQIEEMDNWMQARNNMVYKIARGIKKLEEAKEIIVDDTNIYWKKLYNAEFFVAKNIAYMCKQEPVKFVSDVDIKTAIYNVEQEEGYALEEEQKKAVVVSMKNRISVITGGPGRGKSTIIKTIIAAWGDNSRVALCAPTGRAAQKMRDITNLPAETIHRMKCKPAPNGHLVVVDETSMVDILLADDLIEWAKDCNLVLVGDADQLPSIGAGSFFRDLIRSDAIPTVKLVKGHRNQGSIARNSMLINKGSQMKDYSFNEDFKFVSAEDSEVQEAIIKEYLRMRNKYGEKEVCVLAPMRQRTSSAVNELNKVLRDIVNPYKRGGRKLSGSTFREGDRVMQIKNNYQKQTRLPHGERLAGVFNGDCGNIKYIDQEDNTVMVEFDNKRTAIYEKYELAELTLAYAMTIHKCQGSEYKGIIIVHSKGHYIMLARSLLYTAVTRARDEVCLIGDRSAFNNAATNRIVAQRGEEIRNTKLRKRIKESF